MRWATRGANALVLLLALAGRAGAQSGSRTAALGVAVPLEHYAAHRSAGPLLRAGLTFGGDDRRVRLRLEAEGAWLFDRVRNPFPGGSTDGTLRILGALATVTAGPRGVVEPYVLFGLGPQWLHASGDRSPNPYGMVPGVRAGAGIRARFARTEWYAEFAFHGVASDYATGHDFAAGTYLPIVIAVRF